MALAMAWIPNRLGTPQSTMAKAPVLETPETRRSSLHELTERTQKPWCPLRHGFTTIVNLSGIANGPSSMTYQFPPPAYAVQLAHSCSGAS